LIYVFHGALTGLNKDEVKKELGEEKFLLYRRSYDVPPPPLSEDDKRHPRFDPKYKNLPIELIPNTESLKDNQIRSMAAFHEKVAPLLVQGKEGMVKEFDNISDEDIPKFEIATGVPRVYEFDEDLHIKKVYNLD